MGATKEPQRQHLGYIHTAVLLFGLAGLFAEWVALPPVWIVEGRVIFAALGLSVLLAYRKQSLRLQAFGDFGWMLAQGVLLAFHWVCFFASIQLSTVAIGLLTFSTFPVFTAVLEPLVLKEPWRWRDGLFAGIALIGVALVVPSWSQEDPYFLGAMWGIASGLSFAVLALVNRHLVKRYSGAVIAWYQDVIAAVVLVPFVVQTAATPTWADVGLLLLLGLVFTAVAHTLFIQGMAVVRAQTASLIASLEPLYGIGAAALLLGQVPVLQVWLGGALILGVVAAQTWLGHEE